MSSHTKRRGRPPGSQNKSYDYVESVPARCPRCGSTKRSRYYSTRVHRISGVHQGVEYNQIVWRRTRCVECQQHRVEKAYEMAD